MQLPRNFIFFLSLVFILYTNSTSAETILIEKTGTTRHTLPVIHKGAITEPHTICFVNKDGYDGVSSLRVNILDKYTPHPEYNPQTISKSPYTFQIIEDITNGEYPSIDTFTKGIDGYSDREFLLEGKQDTKYCVRLFYPDDFATYTLNTKRNGKRVVTRKPINSFNIELVAKKENCSGTHSSNINTKNLEEESSYFQTFKSSLDIVFNNIVDNHQVYMHAVEVAGTFFAGFF